MRTAVAGATGAETQRSQTEGVHWFDFDISEMPSWHPIPRIVAQAVFADPPIQCRSHGLEGHSMLHEFLTVYRAAIITRTRQKLTNRPWPLASTSELEHGVPLFLTQLSEALRQEATAEPFPQATIGASATLHGGDLLRRGFNVSQVVHDYGDICQAITELVVENRVPVTGEEFQVLNRCLDTAIAEAVTEHARITAEMRGSEEVERSGRVAHESRDMLNSAIFAFEALKRGTVAVSGSTAAVLGRNLMGLRDLVNSTLSDVRITGNYQRRQWMSVTSFLSEIEVAARLHADSRSVQFIFEGVDPELAFNIDPQLIESAVMNLLNNAFKYTPTHGCVVLRARREGACVHIEVEDACGGIEESADGMFQPFGERRGKDRSGLGLGLSIARKAVRAHGGEIHIRNIPGKGCVCVVQIPLAEARQPAAPAIV
jgi:signal transduction histidine kinase